MLWKHFKGLRLEAEFLTLRGSILTHIFPNGVKQSAFWSSVVRLASAATRNLQLTASAVIDATYQADRNLIMNAAVATTFTLPNATGSGNTFRFIVGAVNTSSYLIKSNRGADVMKGLVFNSNSASAGAARGWNPAATDDTVTLNGTTTGGSAVGDWIEFRDAGLNTWIVHGMTTANAAPATPFSDTVA